ncbi:serine protease [Evansella sp. LMS18]|uniref:serine protease n=1 Tax=Evansella sp. LMS18 TaxID=2924033 RepID=UPI0020D0F4D5|nr:serine protease [Evansella sp. LMS18]UTR12149.1 serine protease [Evansella sp. LMS18]
MKGQHIEAEIRELENRLDFLKKQLQETQEHCDHHFEGNNFMEKCLKCNKVNVLYY